jgi:hypothetical protein
MARCANFARASVPEAEVPWFYATSDWPVNVIAVPELANL